MVKQTGLNEKSIGDTREDWPGKKTKPQHSTDSQRIEIASKIEGPGKSTLTKKSIARKGVDSKRISISQQRD